MVLLNLLTSWALDKQLIKHSFWNLVLCVNQCQLNLVDCLLLPRMVQWVALCLHLWQQVRLLQHLGMILLQPLRKIGISNAYAQSTVKTMKWLKDLELVIKNSCQVKEALTLYLIQQREQIALICKMLFKLFMVGPEIKTKLVAVLSKKSHKRSSLLSKLSTVDLQGIKAPRRQNLNWNSLNRLSSNLSIFALA